MPGTTVRGRVIAACCVLVSLSLSPAYSRNVSGGSRSSPPSLPANRPNIILLISDDQAYSTFDPADVMMPTVYGELIGKGVSFSRAYDETSLCCPSRAQIMTGLHEHNTLVDDNGVALKIPTFIPTLHDNGYRTMLAGKYLNSAPCTPRLEFDEWVCAAKTPTRYRLYSPDLNVDGTVLSFPGQYETDVLADYVVSFIDSTPSDQPFFISLPQHGHLGRSDAGLERRGQRRTVVHAARPVDVGGDQPARQRTPRHVVGDPIA
jgi:hypothetical protein